MNKKKLLLTIAGAGVMGMLTGCGASEPIEMSATTEQFTPELLEQSENSRESVSGDRFIEQFNKPVSEESPDGNTNQAVTGNMNNSPSGEIASGEDKQSEPKPKDVKEVIALTDSEEEARKIAELYQIEFQSYAQGVAVYTTDKNVAELIQMGKDNNYPALAPNNQQQLY